MIDIRCGIRSVLASALFFALPYGYGDAATQVTISRKTEVDNGATSKTLDLQIPYGWITYKGRSLGAEGEAIEGVQFGLNFHRPPKTNGGWDGWNFMNVGITRDSRPLQVFKTYLLDDVHLLESGRRSMLQFVWHLADGSPVFTVTVLQYPTHPDWIFIKVKAEAEHDTLDTITLNCYPGNTSGPPERERWLATLKATYRIDGKMAPVEPPYNSFIFFNQLAQQNTGCLLATDPKIIETVSIRGGSSAQTSIRFLPDQTEATFAFGAYTEKSTEDIIRVFRMEGSTQIEDFLARIDWSPKLDLATYTTLTSVLDELVRDQPSAISDRFHELKARYETLKNENRTAEALQTMNELVELKDRLIKEALSKWK